jgi:hypothetical protein
MRGLRLASEPPFRLLTRWFVQRFCEKVETRARWGVDPYPYYQYGILTGANSAKRDGRPAITVIEFGVASGGGLLAMERHARAIEHTTSVKIAVIGFDSGAGLPTFCDHRDHPDLWKPGDYRFDISAVEKQIDQRRTRIIVGDVRETVPAFLQSGDFAPIGFVSFDLDIYSSTIAALQILGAEARRVLRQTPLYFDDIDFINNHRWAGELLAIREFNNTYENVKIDKWYGIRIGKPFPEAHYWNKMMVAHDLSAISSYVRN